MIPPLYHSAIGHLLGPMVVGARSVLLTEAITPRTIFETMSAGQLSVVFLLVPWTLDILGALDRGELRLRDYECGAGSKGELPSTRLIKGSWDLLASAHLLLNGLLPLIGHPNTFPVSPRALLLGISSEESLVRMFRILCPQLHHCGGSVSCGELQSSAAKGSDAHFGSTVTL